jgi:Family of unknown function (DUF6410)
MAGRIGPMGLVARLAVGVAFVGLALFWDEVGWQQVLLGLVVLPAIVVGVAAVRARWSPQPLRATGPLGHALNTAVFLPLFLIPATVGAALLFYGASMMVAGLRRSGGCEVTALSNALLRRDDQVGCVLFAPVDLAEQGVRRRSGSPAAGH